MRITDGRMGARLLQVGNEIFNINSDPRAMLRALQNKARRDILKFAKSTEDSGTTVYLEVLASLEERANLVVSDLAEKPAQIEKAKEENDGEQ